MAETSVAVYQGRGLQLAKAMKLCQRMETSFPSAAALLAVHSAIAYTDAVLIKLTGERSRTRDHSQAIPALKRACGEARIEPRGIEQLKKLLGSKSNVSYGDKDVDLQLAGALCAAADRFEAWAERFVLKRG